MTVYIINIILCFLACATVKNRVTYYGDYIRPNKKPALVFIFLLWVVLYAFRYRVGSDSWSFNASFEAFVRTDYRFADMLTLRRDWMFSIIEYIAVKILGFNRIGLYAVLGALTYGPILMVFNDIDSSREDFDLSFAVMLFIGTMQFYSGFNGTRQAIATAFCMLAYYKYLRKGRYVGYALCMIVAFGFHSAAMFALPFQLLSLKRLNSWLVRATVIGLLLSCAFLPSVWNSVIALLDAFGQVKMANDYVIFQTKGSNILRTLVAVTPVMMSLVYREGIALDDPDFEPDLVLSIFSTIFMIFSVRSAIFARVASLVGISTVFTISRLDRISHQKGLLKTIIVTLYFAYMTLLLLDGDGHYYPYQFVPSFDATW